MAVTLADVARRAGVSTAAASMVLSGKYEGRVSEKRAKVIEEAAAELDYVRNDLAQGLRTKKTNTIGIVTDNVASTPYAVDMIAAATTEARKHGYLLMLIETGGERQATREAFTALKSRRVDGVAFASMYHHEVELPSNADKDLIILDGYADDPTFTAVVPDEVQGAHDAVEHLIKLGHTRIGFINESESKDAGPLRLQGFRKAHEEYGIDVNEDLILHCVVDDQEPTYKAVKALLSSPNRPSALFCYNDKTAALVYRAAKHLKLDIPDDLSVVGFDNFQSLTSLMDPGLTTVQLPHAAMARWVINQLVTGESAEPETAVNNKHLFECPLVLRESTAPPAKN